MNINKKFANLSIIYNLVSTLTKSILYLQVTLFMYHFIIEGKIPYFQHFNILPETHMCGNCEKAHSNIVIREHKAYFVCPTPKCREKKTVRTGTFLYNSNLSLTRIILLIYSFTQVNWTYDQGKSRIILTSF